LVSDFILSKCYKNQIKQVVEIDGAGFYVAQKNTQIDAEIEDDCMYRRESTPSLMLAGNFLSFSGGGMWYGATKVGIIDIDTDHANVDTMLQLYFSGVVDERYLKDIVLGLCRHFDHEVHIIETEGGTFPQRHRDEHERLKVYLNDMLVANKLGELDGQALAEEVRDLLLLHVVDFDLGLAECIP
jgi:hemerythrin